MPTHPQIPEITHVTESELFILLTATPTAPLSSLLAARDAFHTRLTFLNTSENRCQD
jgi:hypothetical protein